MRFLIARMSSMGDVVHTLPVASALKTLGPEVEVVWACSQRWSSIVELCSSVDQVVIASGKPLGDWKLARTLGAFDAALDMQGLFKTGILVAGAQARERLGYHWQREGSWLFSSPVKPDPTSLHVIDQYVDVARALGAQVHWPDFALAPLPEDVEKIRGLLAGAGRDFDRKLVAVNPSSAKAAKRWAPDCLARAVNLLHGAGIQCVFLGTPGDKAAFAEVEACGLPPVLNLIGQTSPRELVALISLSDAHVGGDTGSTHIAAALEKPAYSVYTATRAERSCPYGQFRRCQTSDPDELAGQMIKELLG
jgi:ADP-heptose:LPS heptosyltransferase